MFTIDTNVSPEVKQNIFQKCQQILTGTWKEASLEDLRIDRIKCGIANRVYHVQLLRPKFAEVIVRLNGSENFQNVDSPKIFGDARDIMVFFNLSLKGLGPKLLGTFHNGRIEEYIPHIPIERDDFEPLNIDLLVGHKLAVIHKLTLPITKSPDYFIRIFAYIKELYLKWMEQSLDELTFLNPEGQKLVKKIYAFDLLREVEWTFKSYPQIRSPIVFSHNDVNVSNILLKREHRSSLDKIMLIDFELSSYNYRAYDLAYYVNLKYFDLSKGPPSCGQYKYPTGQERAALRAYYLEEWMKDNIQFNPEVDNDAHLEMEMNFFSLMHDLQVIGWNLIRTKSHANIAFAQVCEHKINKYKEDKKTFVAKYGEPSKASWRYVSVTHR